MELLISISGSIIADAILIQMGHTLPMDKSIQFPLTLIFGQAQENDENSA